MDARRAEAPVVVRRSDILRVLHATAAAQARAATTTGVPAPAHTSTAVSAVSSDTGQASSQAMGSDAASVDDCAVGRSTSVEEGNDLGRDLIAYSLPPRLWASGRHSSFSDKGNLMAAQSTKHRSNRRDGGDGIRPSSKKGDSADLRDVSSRLAPRRLVQPRSGAPGNLSVAAAGDVTGPTSVGASRTAGASSALTWDAMGQQWQRPQRGAAPERDAAASLLQPRERAEGEESPWWIYLDLMRQQQPPNANISDGGGTAQEDGRLAAEQCEVPARGEEAPPVNANSMLLWTPCPPAAGSANGTESSSSTLQRPIKPMLLRPPPRPS
jgi:hypothetical protein